MVWESNNRPLVGGFFMLLVVATAPSGCGPADGPRCQPVVGQVLYRGRPVPEALVVFHPARAPDGNWPKPMATCDAEGRFALTTWSSHDGAPLGEYTVTIECRAPSMRGEEIVRDGPNQLPPRYAAPGSSDLRVTVAAGENKLPPFRLQ